MGVADSSCKTCCDSEPLLNDILKKVKDKTVLSYPEKTTKKGKKVIIRKEIPLVRIDVANKELLTQLQYSDIVFFEQVKIFFVKKGKLFKYDGYFG